MDRTAGSSDVRLMFEENRAGIATVSRRDNLYMHLLWLLTLRGGRGHWEERQGSCAGSFHYGYESVRPAISVCQQNVWRGLFWNCVYVNAFTQSPGQVSLPSRSGLACRRGLWKVIRSDFSRAKKLLPSLADTLSAQLSGELLPHVNPSHRALAGSTCGEKEVCRHNRRPTAERMYSVQPWVRPTSPHRSKRASPFTLHVKSAAGPEQSPGGHLWLWTAVMIGCDSNEVSRRGEPAQTESRSLCLLAQLPAESRFQGCMHVFVNVWFLLGRKRGTISVLWLCSAAGITYFCWPTNRNKLATNITHFSISSFHHS